MEAMAAIETYLHAVERERLVIEGRVRVGESDFFSREGRPLGFTPLPTGL